MKVKFVNVITVFLITLIVISPAIVVLRVVWEKHIELVKTQNLTCEVHTISKVNQSVDTAEVITNSSPHQTSVNYCDRSIVNQPLTVDVYKLAIILQWFILLTPICIGLGILLYDRYLAHRATVFQEQVEMLERLWQQSIEQ